MKRNLVVLAVVLAMAVSGCCNKVQLDGTTKKEISLACIQDTICNADPATVAAVDVFLSFAKPLIPDALPGSPLLKAVLTAENIKTYGCAGLTELTELIIFIGGINTAQAKASQVKGFKMAAAPIAVEPIIAWVDRSGK